MHGAAKTGSIKPTHQTEKGSIHIDTSTSYGLFVKLIRVKHLRSLVHADTCKNSGTIKNFVKTVNYLEILT